MPFPSQPPQGDRKGQAPRQNNNQRVMNRGQESANMFANSNRGSGSYRGNSGREGFSNHQNFSSGNVPMNVPVFDNRNRSSQNGTALRDHIPPQQYNNGRGGNGRGNFRGQHNPNNIPFNHSSRSNAPQGNNTSMNQSFANKNFSNNQMNGQGRGRGNHQGHQHPNGSYQQNNSRRGRNYSDAGQPSHHQQYGVQQYPDRGRGQRRGNVPYYSNDVSRHNYQPSSQDQHNKSFGYGGEPHRGSNGGGNRNSVDMNKSFAVPQCYQDGDDSVFHEEDGPSTSGQHNRGRRKNFYRKGNKQRNMNKSFGGYMQQDNGSSGHPYRQAAPVQLSENVPVVVQHPINMHQIVPTEEVPTEQMKELAINPKPKKSSRSRRRNKKRSNTLNATMPEQELDETHNGSVNMNQTIGCIARTGILKVKSENDERPKRSKSVIFGSPPTPRALWSEERTLHSTGLGLRQRASQNANDSICVVDAVEEENFPPSWKNTAVIHVSQVIKTKSDARFVGLYLAHRGVVTPMPDIIVKNGKVIFVVPNTIVLKKMPSNFLFNLYPSEGHKKGQLLAGRYYYADNNQIAGGTKSLPNKFTISNLPEHLLDVDKYNAEVQSKVYMEAVLAEFMPKKPALEQSILKKTDVQLSQQDKAKEEPVLEATNPAESSSHMETTAVPIKVPILTTSPVCRTGPKPLPRPMSFHEPIIVLPTSPPMQISEQNDEVHAPKSEAATILEQTAQVQVLDVKAPIATDKLILASSPESSAEVQAPIPTPKPISESTVEVQAPMPSPTPSPELISDIVTLVPTPSPILEPVVEVQVPMSKAVPSPESTVEIQASVSLLEQMVEIEHAPMPMSLSEPIVEIQDPVSLREPIVEVQTPLSIPMLSEPAVDLQTEMPTAMPILETTPILEKTPILEVTAEDHTPIPLPEPTVEVKATDVQDKPARRPMLLPPQVKKGNSEAGRARKPVGPLNGWTPEKVVVLAPETDAKSPERNLDTVVNVVETTNNVIAADDTNPPAQNVGPLTQDPSTPARDVVVDPNYATPRSGKKRLANFPLMANNSPLKSRQTGYDGLSVKKPRCSNTLDDGMTGYETPSVDPSVAGPSARAPVQVRRPLRSMGQRLQRNSTGIPLPLDPENDETMEQSQKTSPSPAMD